MYHNASIFLGRLSLSQIFLSHTDKMLEKFTVHANSDEATVTWIYIEHYLMLMGTTVSPQFLADGC